MIQNTDVQDHMINVMQKQTIQNLIKPPVDNYKIKNPNEEYFSKITENQEKQISQSNSIYYENKKLNAQIEVLNKTIDSKNGELNKLRDINNQLKITNQTLLENQQSNRGYWFKTILVGIFTTILGILLGKYM